MTTPASPEQFLREFGTAILAASLHPRKTVDDVDSEVKGWAKLLELREQEARRDELVELKNYWNATAQSQDLYSVVSEIQSRIDRRLIKLTTPNNTTNTLEDEETTE